MADKDYAPYFLLFFFSLIHSDSIVYSCQFFSSNFISSEVNKFKRVAKGSRKGAEGMRKVTGRCEEGEWVFLCSVTMFMWTPWMRSFSATRIMWGGAMSLQYSTKSFMYHVYTMKEEFFRALQQQWSFERPLKWLWDRCFCMTDSDQRVELEKVYLKKKTVQLKKLLSHNVA